MQQARVGSGFASTTWKEQAESRALADNTAQDWAWSANRDQPGLESGEWFVRYVDKAGSGYFWLARPETGAVIYLNSDRIAGYRVSQFSVRDESIKVTVSEQGFFNCGAGDTKAWCFHLVGTATNVGEPLVETTSELGLIVKVGDRTEEGKDWYRHQNPLPSVSESKPWENGRTIPFEYWSKAIPEIYARTSGEALVYLEVTSSSLTWSNVTSPVFVSKLSWPPSAVDGGLPHAPPMEVPDFAAQPDYQFSAANVDSFCREEWTKRGELNKEMFVFCTNKEKEGHADVVELLTKLRQQDWLATLFPTIWSKWTKQGITNYHMVAFNLNQQSEAFLDYQYALKQPSFDAARMGECEAEWAGHDSRWTMTMHCYKK